MTIKYPTGLDKFSPPVANNGPSQKFMADAIAALHAIEAKLGITDSAVTTSLDYRVKLLEGVLGSYTEAQIEAAFTKPAIWNVTPNGATAVTVEQFRGCFITVPRRMSFDRARVRVGTGSAGALSVALYTKDGQTRLTTSGEVSTAANGTNMAITLPEIVVDAGVYYLGASVNTAAGATTWETFTRGQILGASAQASGHPAPTTVSVDDGTAGTLMSVGIYHS